MFCTRHTAREGNEVIGPVHTLRDACVCDELYSSGCRNLKFIHTCNRDFRSRTSQNINNAHSFDFFYAVGNWYKHLF